MFANLSAKYINRNDGNVNQLQFAVDNIMIAARLDEARELLKRLHHFHPRNDILNSFAV